MKVLILLCMFLILNMPETDGKRSVGSNENDEQQELYMRRQKYWEDFVNDNIDTAVVRDFIFYRTGHNLTNWAIIGSDATGFYVRDIQKISN